MIDYEELTIGDWVEYKGDLIRVEELLQEGINGEWELWGELSGVMCYDDLRPIPLSDKILEMSGFVCAPTKWGTIWTHPIFRFIIASEGYPDYIVYNTKEDLGKVPVCKLHAVHTLQHLLRLTDGCPSAYNIKVYDAKIVYRKGFEGQNTLDAIEGIEISLNDGHKALVYPKYARCQMIRDNFDFEDWDAVEMTKKEALSSSGDKENDELYRINSPAAKYVSQFSTFSFGMRDIPTLAVAKAIVNQMTAIDAQARKIDGADLLEKNLMYGCERMWSCARANDRSCYIVNPYGYIYTDNVNSMGLCVPCVLNYTE